MPLKTIFPCRLSLGRPELMLVFARIVNMPAPAADEKAIFDFGGAFATIDYLGRVFTVPAHGHWLEPVTVPARFVFTLACAPPSTAQFIELAHEKSRLHVGTSSIACNPAASVK
jgi:hypothetical protein